MLKLRDNIRYVQFILILFVFLEAYKDTPFGMWFFSHKMLTYPAFLVLFFAISIGIGALDKKYIRTAELGEIAETNPILMDIKKKVDEMHENS
ncbi:hypothetical protein LCGC14_2684040 [marine sediment metagenome]|uniref:Uncharacterized protein n=1 Tax=marine sediment metagenome TaxID=412755 RepID=A0A0F9A809_9ZZZZ